MEAVKLKDYTKIVKPVVVCGSETWSVTEMDMKRLNTWEKKMLRRIYGPVVEQGVWRIRNNQKNKELGIVADIKRKRL
jgi:hypothetical protein